MSDYFKPCLTSRRVRILRCSSDFFVMMFSAGEHLGYNVVENAIPDGTVVLNVRFAWPDVMEVLLEHESFEEVADGVPFPVVSPRLTTILPSDQMLTTDDGEFSQVIKREEV